MEDHHKPTTYLPRPRRRFCKEPHDGPIRFAPRPVPGQLSFFDFEGKGEKKEEGKVD